MICKFVDWITGRCADREAVTALEERNKHLRNHITTIYERLEHIESRVALVIQALERK